MTRSEFHRAIDAGVYPDSERLELLDGQVVERVTNNPPHAGTVLAIATWLRSVVPDNCVVLVQSPLALDDKSEPEPDIAVAEGRPRDFFVEHPVPAQTRLAIEVSDSSLHEDQRVKLPLYANAGIPEYWIVDLRRRRVLIHREPVRAGYRSVVACGINDLVELTWAPGASVAVRELLP